MKTINLQYHNLLMAYCDTWMQVNHYTCVFKLECTQQLLTFEMCIRDRHNHTAPSSQFIQKKRTL